MRSWLGEAVDKEFTTVDDVAEIALLFAAFPTDALTGQCWSLTSAGSWSKARFLGNAKAQMHHS